MGGTGLSHSPELAMLALFTMESSHGGRASASRGLQDPSFTHEQLSHFKISVFTGALHEKVTLCCCGEDSVFPMVEHVFIQVTENTLITCG